MSAKRNVDSVALDRRALDEALAAWDITKWPGVTKRNQTQLAEAVASVANDASGEGVGFVKRAVALEATSSGRRFGRVGIGWRLRMNRGCARTDSDHHYALFHITPRDLGPLVPSDWWQDNRLPSPFPKDL